MSNRDGPKFGKRRMWLFGRSSANLASFVALHLRRFVLVNDVNLNLKSLYLLLVTTRLSSSTYQLAYNLHVVHYNSWLG